MQEFDSETGFSQGFWRRAEALAPQECQNRTQALSAGENGMTDPPAEIVLGTAGTVIGEPFADG
jgi:hypothetical protein